MKKYISIAVGVALAMGIATTASAGPTCRNGMCTDGGGGGNAQSCIDAFGRTITWEFTDFEGPYERCSWGPPPRFSDKPDGSFALLGGCQNIACGGLKKAPSFSSAVAARGSSGAVSPSTAPSSRAAISPAAGSPASTPTPSRPLTSSELLVRSRVQAIMGRPVAPSAPSAPSAPAGSSALAVFSRPATSLAPSPAQPAALPASLPAYTTPAARAGVIVAPPPSYFAQWAKPASTECSSATSQILCRIAAAAIQGNSMGTPKNTCQWLDYLPVGRQCAMVQLP